MGIKQILLRFLKENGMYCDFQDVIENSRLDPLGRARLRQLELRSGRGLNYAIYDLPMRVMNVYSLTWFGEEKTKEWRKFMKKWHYFVRNNLHINQEIDERAIKSIKMINVYDINKRSVSYEDIDVLCLDLDGIAFYDNQRLFHCASLAAIEEINGVPITLGYAYTKKSKKYGFEPASE